MLLPFEIASSEEALLFLISSQLCMNVSSMTSLPQAVLWDMVGGKGTACEAVRGTAQFAEMHASWILAIVMRTLARLAMDIDPYCALAPLLSPEAKQSHLRVAW